MKERLFLTYSNISLYFKYNLSYVLYYEVILREYM